MIGRLMRNFRTYVIDDTKLWFIYQFKVKPHWRKFDRELAEINREIDELRKENQCKKHHSETGTACTAA